MREKEKEERLFIFEPSDSHPPPFHIISVQYLSWAKERPLRSGRQIIRLQDLPTNTVLAFLRCHCSLPPHLALEEF